MVITDIRFRKTFDEGTLRAVLSVTFDGCFALHDIKIISSADRLFVAMPSRKDENGIFRDIAHPIYAEAREELEKEILDSYEKYLALDKVMKEEDFSS